VLKPGGHVVAFSGTRTYHRMACAIEDAGFEVRNMLSWNFGSGFPKSHNISKTLDDKKERCSCPAHLRDLRCNVDSEDALSSGSQQDMRSGLPEGIAVAKDDGPFIALRSTTDGQLCGVREAVHAPDIASSASGNAGLLKKMQRSLSGRGLGEARPQGQSGAQDVFSDVRPEKSCLEGRRDLPKATRELRERALRWLPTGIDINGPDGWLCDGTSAGHGSLDWATVDADRVRSPSRPQAAEQPAIELGALAGQSQPQISGAWDHCGRCGKPLVPDGLGTDLKPAHEPICLARKPLSEKTIALNVLRWGCGAINVDGCRISGDPWKAHHATGLGSVKFFSEGEAATIFKEPHTSGRWPANIIHDGSEEVLAAFPDEASGGFGTRGAASGVHNYGFDGHGQVVGYGDSGSPARFFYTAKADSSDRIGSRHPTVKPVDLMQWLVRLVTPKGGVVLDPFAGTGTTGEAAFREGVLAVLIEREEEYQADIRRRMALCMAGPEERKRESIKAKLGDVPFEAGTLFA
jgi:hypothetical protein